MSGFFHPAETWEGAQRGGPFGEQFCLRLLVDTQNSDGGWGYRVHSPSSVEATSWSLSALAAASKQWDWTESADRGVDWLGKSQLTDGSWPQFRGHSEGCWVTALACSALHEQGRASDAVAKGIAWLCNTWPGEGGLWWRLRHRMVASSEVVRQNHGLQGWSWTPGTSSWVEPTSHVLMLLRSFPGAASSRRTSKRRRLGEGMLYDRMCPEGGWNCGNPMVYGVAGQPMVIPTVWALLALQDYRGRPENQKSLCWLWHAYDQIQGPGSLSLAHLCLETYGRTMQLLGPALGRLYLKNQFFHNTLVLAWASLALCRVSSQLSTRGPENG